jgi:2-methylcitrate dehydratase PrpD
MDSPETQLGSFVATLRYDDIPDDVVQTVLRAFTDTAGVILAGSAEGAGAVAFENAGLDPATASPPERFGVDGVGSPAETALRVGTASHALDYDDLSWGMDGHPSVVLVPPLLAVAPELSPTGRDLVTAYVAGFEVACAVAQPISPDHYEAGWHATATFGALGAAAAVANLCGLDAERTATALNAAASTPAGLKRNFGSMTKPLHAGLAARSGVTAATLARDGLTTDATAVSGERGFWDLYAGDQRKGFERSDGWAVREHGIHVKAYPCCYFTHTSIAASQALSDENGIEPDAIERVVVRTSQGAADALHHADPETGLEAKFSMEYAVASAIVRDRIGLATFEDDAVDHPTVQRVREQVDFAVDTDLHYDSHETYVRIETADDAVERRQDNPPGVHEDPLDEDRFYAKFGECTKRVVNGDRVEPLYDLFSRLDEHDAPVTALRGV